MSGDQQERDRHLVRSARRAGVRSSAARAALGRMREQGQLTGDDDVDLTALLALSEPSGSPRYPWMHEERWDDHAQAVHLDLHCLYDENLTESWVLPAPAAALLAANWALRLAIQPGHDALTRRLDVKGPLFLWDGYIEFAPARYDEQPSAWAWDLDPHSRTGGAALRTDFTRICGALRSRLDRRTGPVLVEPRAGKVLTLDDQMIQDGLVAPDPDVDPAGPPSDRVGLRVEAHVDGDQCVDLWDEFMDGVRSVGEWVARAFGGPLSGRDEEDFGPPGSGRVDFSWHTFPAALLDASPYDEAVSE